MAKGSREPKNVAAVVSAAILEEVRRAGFDLWDVEYVKEGSEWYLRITIDSPDGVDLDDCERVIMIVDPIVTELDPIEGQYHLEVSSPGLERVLRTDRHFLSVVGQEICIKLFTPVSGKKEWIGKLVSYADGVLTLECKDVTVLADRKNVSKANVRFDFDSIPEGNEEA